MTAIIIVLYVFAAAGPLLAFVLARNDTQNLRRLVGYDRSDYLAGEHWANIQDRALVRDRWLIGSSVVVASIAGIVSLWV